jgi:hypothetical protein
MTAAQIQHKLDVSHRILGRGPWPGVDPTVYTIICRELRADIPRLERRLLDLGPPVGAQERRSDG